MESKNKISQSEYLTLYCKEDMIRSLNVAITKCGGGGSYETCKNMTVEALIDMLAPNGVRFTYETISCGDHIMKNSFPTIEMQVNMLNNILNRVK